LEITVNIRKTDGHSLTVVLPKYELIDKDGNVYGPYASAYHAGLAAKAAWPDQEQDEERRGYGWDVQAVIPNLS
jgi:hypothetical protein